MPTQQIAVFADEQQHIFDGQKRWTRADCNALEARGWLPEHFELVDGRIVPKVGQGFRHAVCLSKAFFRVAQIWENDQALTRCLLEVSESDQTTNFPQPDVFVCAKSAFMYTEDIRGSDTILIVEIADGTIKTDMTIKAALYARAHAPELWVLDVQEQKMYVHRFPFDGVYKEISSFNEDEIITPLFAPHVSFCVSSLLHPELTTKGQGIYN